VLAADSSGCVYLAGADSDSELVWTDYFSLGTDEGDQVVVSLAGAAWRVGTTVSLVGQMRKPDEPLRCQAVPGSAEAVFYVVDTVSLTEEGPGG
jgi:hypothetical protein